MRSNAASSSSPIRLLQSLPVELELEGRPRFRIDLEVASELTPSSLETDEMVGDWTEPDELDTVVVASSL